MSSLTRWQSRPEGDGAPSSGPSVSRPQGPEGAVQTVSVGSPQPSSPGSKSVGSEDHRGRGSQGSEQGDPFPKVKERPWVPSTNIKGANREKRQGRPRCPAGSILFLTRYITLQSLACPLSPASLTGVTACRPARGLGQASALPRGQRWC